MKFWQHVNLAILKNHYLAALKCRDFHKFWNISHLIFAISQTETLVIKVFKTFTMVIEH